MAGSRWFIPGSLILLPLLSSCCALGQVAAAPGSGKPEEPFRIQPYCMVQESTFEREGRGGIVTRTARESKHCRDSRGRERTEVTMHTNRGDGRSQDAGSSVYMLDPVTGTIFSWTQGEGSDKIVQVQHVKPFVPAPESFLTPQVSSVWEDTTKPEPRLRSTREPLGQRTISGVLAQGTRYTQQVPVGYLGNNAEYSSVSEQWVAVDFLVTLEQKMDDPAGEMQTTVLKSFTPGEPDETTFAMPVGYAVNDPVPASS